MTMSYRSLLLTVGLTLIDVRDVVVRERQGIIDSHCKLDGKLRPRLRTLDRRVRPEVRELQALIRDIDRSVRIVRKITTEPRT